VSGSIADRSEGGRLAESLTDAVAKLMRHAATKILLPRFRTLASDEQEEKAAGEVVTIADRESEAILSEGLAQLFPEASIVGEEAVHARPDLLECLGDQWCWIVDPLDGTAYFADGLEPFGIIIALANGGRTVGGWILDPISGRLCWAAAGAGCWIDGTRLVVKAESHRRPAISLSPLLHRRPERMKAIGLRLESNYRLVEMPRCAAAHYPAMLLNGPALTLYERTLPWDHAAGVLLLEEADGRASRLDGTPYRVGEDRVGLLAATDPNLWAEAAALLQDLPN
jgi:fructose-1,6-bisphosphatase/inositol monophosphatase family enzyme